MAAPMFPANYSGTEAQQYMHRARMFRDAALNLADYWNGEPYWPKYALLTHAIELALKAFAKHSVQSGKTPPVKEPRQHDLRGWYDLVLQYGLANDPDVATNIDLLNELHFDHFTRYPQNRQIPDASVIADSTVDHLLTAFTATINPR